jgi:predicted RNase H-like nuclease (RuvC/YqgF family)
MSNFVKILDKPIFNQPTLINDNKPKKVKQVKLEKPKLIKEPKVVIDKSSQQTAKIEKLTAKDYTNEKIDRELKVIDNKIKKLEDEITNNQKLLQDKLSEIIKLNKTMENLNDIKKEVNFTIDI